MCLKRSASKWRKKSRNSARNASSSETVTIANLGRYRFKHVIHKRSKNDNVRKVIRDMVSYLRDAAALRFYVI